ncbi:uncharacterized protein B0H18DRAFT_958864 [Fomitopsis serialis]|uniref:uncharacterized protein n=1 Tax=Fomitopsis serialis TaxID=139415 RepID=UPI0020083434|nr:uncharacterized protein B0H18DRAFT_958864 [Neoantrodia serialis]KAH9916353.1 hypothetical protein B0H18DRAFT_958864 [Neoantrodia serialis]
MAGLGFDKRLISLLAPVLPPFPVVAKSTAICPSLEKSLEVYHLTVCPSYHGTECPAILSKVQPEREVMEEVWRLARDMDPPARLGGWAYMGEIVGSGQEAVVPGLPAKEKAIVEALVFFREGHTPMTLPLVGYIRKTTGTSSCPYPNPSSRRFLAASTLTNDHRTRYKSYVPASTRPHRSPVILALPLESVPVFKLRDIVIATSAPDYALGCKTDFSPMCGLKASFMDGEFMWPAVYNVLPRQYKTVPWRVRGKVAKPSPDHADEALRTFGDVAAVNDQAGSVEVEQPEPELWLVEGKVEIPIF